MVANLLENGTPFPFSKFDDINNVSINVGEQDIPEKDIKYTDKTFEDEE